jgi:hypothetical protein
MRGKHAKDDGFKEKYTRIIGRTLQEITEIREENIKSDVI